MHKKHLTFNQVCSNPTLPRCTLQLSYTLNPYNVQNPNPSIAHSVFEGQRLGVRIISWLIVMFNGLWLDVSIQCEFPQVLVPDYKYFMQVITFYAITNLMTSCHAGFHTITSYSLEYKDCDKKKRKRKIKPYESYHVSQKYIYKYH